METLPPPSPDADTALAPPEQVTTHIPRAGELTVGWRVVTGLGWVLIVAVLAAAWSVSRQLGLSTWWLGPVDDQTPPYVRMIPFLAPSIMIVLAGNRARYVPWLGLFAAAATAAVGLGDLGRVRGVALIELVAATAGLLVSVASFSGMYRSARDTSADDVDEVADIDDVVVVEESVDTGPTDVDESVDAPIYRAGEPTPG